MGFSNIVWFWIVLGALFGPFFLIACIISIVKAVLDRKRIKRNIEAKKLAQLNDENKEGQPQRVKKPNIKLLDDEGRKQKWQNRRPSVHFARKAVPLMGSAVDKNLSNHADLSDISVTSFTSEERENHKTNGHKNNGYHSVHVTVEQNARIPNGVHDSSSYHVHNEMDSKGIDNLGSSFSEEYCRSGYPQQNLEMGNMRVVVHAMTKDSERISQQVDTDIDCVSDSQLSNTSNAYLSDNAVTGYTGRGQQQQQQHQHSKQSRLYQQHEHRPQKPKRNGRHGHHYAHHNEKTQHHSGSLNELNGDLSVLPSLGVHRIRGSRSQEYDLDNSSIYEGSSRRNSYAAAIDTEYNTERLSRKRSHSEDNIKIDNSSYPPYQNALPFYTHIPCRDGGKINKAFIRSTETPLAEM